MCLIEPCQGSGVGSIPIGRSIISATYSDYIFSVGPRRTICCFCRWMNQSNQLQMGCPFSRGQSLCVHVQRQSAACVPHQFLDRLHVLTAAFQERCERSAERNAIPEPW